jgi:hypothetical protein
MPIFSRATICQYIITWSPTPATNLMKSQKALLESNPIYSVLLGLVGTDRSCMYCLAVPYGPADARSTIHSNLPPMHDGPSWNFHSIQEERYGPHTWTNLRSFPRMNRSTLCCQEVRKYSHPSSSGQLGPEQKNRAGDAQDMWRDSIHLLALRVPTLANFYIQKCKDHSHTWGHWDIF